MALTYLWTGFFIVGFLAALAQWLILGDVDVFKRSSPRASPAVIAAIWVAYLFFKTGVRAGSEQGQSML